MLKSKLDIIFLFFSILFISPFIALAEPTISNLSGAYCHGEQVIIAGNDFGNKSPPAPVVWDNSSHGDSLSTRWSGGWPNNCTNSNYDIDYRAPHRSIPLPHSNITKYLAGCHGENGGANAGYNVMFWKTRTISLPAYTYMSWYQRSDDNWDFGLGGGDDNYKCRAYSNGASPYSGTYRYLEYNPRPSSTTNQPKWHMSTGGGIENPDQNGQNAWWDDATNPMSGVWTKIEMEIKHTSDSTGYIKLWDNGVLRIDYLGVTDNMSGTTRQEAIGGYGRSRPSPNNWRYFADMYLDYTRARVIIGNASTLAGSTVREIQIPTAWSNNSITTTVNQGSFANCGTVYLFVVDADGNVNTQGYPIRIVTGAGEPPCPPIGGWISK